MIYERIQRFQASIHHLTKVQVEITIVELALTQLPLIDSFFWLKISKNLFDTKPGLQNFALSY